MKLKRDDFLVPSRTHSPLMQVYFSYLHGTGAKSWPSGAHMNFGDGEQPRAIVHHVFPKTLASDSEIPLERLNCAANFAILSSADDDSLAGELPLESWNRMKSWQRDLAGAQLFISNGSELQLQSFDAFLDHRAAALAAELNTYLGLA